jgi:EF hand domain-containing protein
MNNHFLSKSALVFSILAGTFVVDCGPLTTPVLAQRRGNDNNENRDERQAEERRAGDQRGGDEGRGRWAGRGRWGRRGSGEEGDRRNREPRRENEDEEERDSENRDGADRPRMDVSGYARDLVKKYDKNGNMMLEEEERGDLTGPAARADLNDDKVITVEEIAGSLSNRGSSERGGRDRRSNRERSEGDSDRTAGKTEATAKKRVYTSVTAGSSDKDKEADKRKSYRFTPATERLTGNLPSWFKSRDRNKDGQVSMSEYSRSWTDRLARQYRELDLNDDGVITSKEAAE